MTDYQIVIIIEDLMSMVKKLQKDRFPMCLTMGFVLENCKVV